MKNFLLHFFLITCISIPSLAQPEAIIQEGEVGIALGASHYFGDLNSNLGLRNPKPTLGVIAKKNFGPYVAIRAAAHYVKIGYADSMVNPAKLPFQQIRNLDFQNKLWEVSVQGDFNFFKFIPGNPEYKFTPYVTLGIGIIKTNPYTYYEGVKYNLKPLGTEGQGQNNTFYGEQAYCFPFGMGVKYNLINNINFGFEIVYRYTNSDYLDDVSGVYQTTYINANGLDIAKKLQDRSIGQIKVDGDQRGFSQQKDHYVLAQLSLTYSITSYKCADPR